MESISAMNSPIPLKQNKTALFEGMRGWMLPILGLLLSAVFFHWYSEGAFITSRNLSNLSRQVCVNLTLAVGMTLVILTSGIDLSVGSVVALSGMVAAMTQVQGGFSHSGLVGALLSFGAAILTGGLCGLLTGSLISRFKITPFIVTLGMMVIGRGLTLIISGAQAVAPLGEDLGALSSEYLSPGYSLGFFVIAGIGILVLGVKRKTLDRSVVGLIALAVAAWIFVGYRGIPYMVFIAVLCTAVAGFSLKYLRFGRFLYAIGGNREAAELSGVPVAKTLLLTYLVMGLLAGLSGIMDAARVNGAVPSAGELAELDAIAAVVIGGTSLMGGQGSIGGTVLGVLILGVLNNGMSLMGLSEHYQKLFKGIVIIVAVYLDLRSKKK